MERGLQDQETTVTCVICKNGEVRQGHATVTLQHSGCTIIFKDVPADICVNCGEYYLSETVTQEVTRRAVVAAGSGDEVTVLQYAA